VEKPDLTDETLAVTDAGGNQCMGREISDCTWVCVSVHAIKELEYLVVYGRASMGESWLPDYYRFAFRVLAGFHELLTHGQKFDSESLYKPI